MVAMARLTRRLRRRLAIGLVRKRKYDPSQLFTNEFYAVYAG